MQVIAGEQIRLPSSNVSDVATKKSFMVAIYNISSDFFSLFTFNVLSFYEGCSDIRIVDRKWNGTVIPEISIFLFIYFFLSHTSS